MLVVGENGNGKTTFIKCFQNKSQKSNLNFSNTSNNLSKNNKYGDILTEQSTDSFHAFEMSNAYNAKFNLIDSPGYGSNIDNQKWINMIVKFLEDRVHIY